MEPDAPEAPKPYSVPFYTYDQNGQVNGGYAMQDPKFQAGTAESALFLDSPAAQSLPNVRDFTKRAEFLFKVKLGQETNVIGMARAPFASLEPIAAFKDVDDARRSMTLAEIATEHDSEYVFTTISEKLRDISRSNEGNADFRLHNLSDEDVIAISAGMGVESHVIDQMRASKQNPYKEFGIDLMTKVRAKLSRADSEYELGETVANDLMGELFLEDNPEWKARKFLAYQYYTASTAPNNVNQFTHAIGTLFSAFAETAINVGTGTKEALAGTDEQMLSDKYRQNPDLKNKALAILRRAEDVALTQYNQMKSLSREDMYTAALAFAQVPDNQQLLLDIETLKQDGAFTDASRWSRLYSVFDGAIRGTQEFYRMGVGSTDPNSITYNIESAYDDPDIQGPMSAPYAVIRGIKNAFAGTERYRRMSTQELLRSAKVLEDNYNQAHENSDMGGIARMYKAAGMTEASVAADRLTSLGVSEQASYAIDIPTLAGGVAGMFSKGAKAAKIAGFVDDAMKSKAVTLIGDVVAARGAVAAADDAMSIAVKNLKDGFAARGIQVTENEAIALALSQNLASPEARAALAAMSPDVNTVKSAVGGVLAKNKDVRNATKQLLADAKEAAAKAPKPTVAKGAPVAGAVSKGAGKTAEFTGSVLETLGDLILGTSPERAGMVTRRGAQMIRRGATGASIVGGSMVAYDVFTGEISDIPGAAAEFLKGSVQAAAFAAGSKFAGTVLKTNGKLLSNVAIEIAQGNRKGASIFLESADRLEASVEALRKAGASQEKINKTLADAKLLRNAHKAGWEKPLTEMAVISYQGAKAATTGAVLAYLNNTQAASAGAGFGFGGAMIAGAAARLGQMLPSGVEANREMAVLANGLYVLNRRSPKERALFYEMMERNGIINPDGTMGNRDAAIRMLEGLTLLEGGLMGSFEIIREGELMGRTIGMQHAGINVDAIKTLAGQMYPDDAVMAANYAEALVQRANFQNNQYAKVAALNVQIGKNSKHIEKLKVELDAQTKALALAEQNNNAKRQSELRSQISQTEANIKVLETENQKFTDDVNLEKTRLVDREAVIREADARKLEGKERETFIETEVLNRAEQIDPIRPGEVRNGQVGTSIRQVADGVYINDGEGGKVYINANKANSLTLVHEAFEGILKDDAMKAVMPELVDFLYGQPGSGKRVISDANRQRFFDLYASDLAPELRTKYLEQLKNAEKLYNDTGDFSALLPYVQEASAWWLSVVHDSRPVGYAPGMTTPRGQEAPRPRIFDGIFGKDGRSKTRAMYDLLMGERSTAEIAVDRLAAGADAEWAAFIDPDFGWFGQRTRSFIRSHLESNGFSMLEGSDGTVRGFFREDGVVQRGYLLDDMYEAIARNLGGTSGVRRANFDPLSDPRVSEAVKVEWAQQNGLDHLLTDPAAGPVRVMTPDEMAGVSRQINEGIRDAISTVEPGKSGLQIIDNGNGQTVITGKPTQADIDAVNGNQSIPPGVRQNIVTAMEGAANGTANSVLRGRYVNVRTKQKGVGTEERLRVPRDTGGAVSEEKEFIPLSIVLGMSRDVPGGGRLAAPIPTARIVGLDIKAVKGNLLTMRSRGLFDQEGNIVVGSDGKAFTPERFRELFPTDAQYWNAVNVYTTHLMAAGKIDPTNNRPVMPANMEPTAAVLARMAGNPSDLKLGEAMRDAIRFGLGIDSRKDLVLIHPSPYKKVLRDINQTITDFRIDGLGKLMPTGEQFAVDSNVIAWSQANMSPSTWTKLSKEGLAGLAPAGEGWSVSSAVYHPNTQHIIVQDSRKMEGGKPEVRFRIYDKSGSLIENQARTMQEAREAVRNKMATDEANSAIADALAEAIKEEDRIKMPVLKEAANKAGYTVGPVFHGTPTGGFYVFDAGRTGTGGGVSRGGFSFTTNKEAATSYSMSVGASPASEMVVSANKIFRTSDPKKFIFDTPANEIELKLENLDYSGKGDVADAQAEVIRDYADKYEAAGMKEQADQLRAVASMAASKPTPEVKSVFLRIGDNPLIVKTTRKNMANDLWGVRAEKGRNVIVELEDGERIFYINDPSDIKSAEPFVFDDNGVEVPLERRFGPGADIRGDLSGLKERTKKGKAFMEEQAYYAARAKRIAEIARRIAKEKEIKFTRENNADVEAQRKWEEEAARRAEGERKAEARRLETERKQAEKDAYDAAKRQRDIDNKAGKAFRLPSEQLSLAERYYLGDDVKLRKALEAIDKTGPGLVNLQKMLQTPMEELGVGIEKQTSIQGVGLATLPVYKKALMFTKRPLSKVNQDIAAARAGQMGTVSEAMSMRPQSAEALQAYDYIMSNAAGGVIVSELRKMQGKPPIRVFSVYSSGMKVKIMETEDFREALQETLISAYRNDAKAIAEATKLPAITVEGMAETVRMKSMRGEPLAPQVIQRYTR